MLDNICIGQAPGEGSNDCLYSCAVIIDTQKLRVLFCCVPKIKVCMNRFNC